MTAGAGQMLYASTESGEVVRVNRGARDAMWADAVFVTYLPTEAILMFLDGSLFAYLRGQGLVQLEGEDLGWVTAASGILPATGIRTVLGGRGSELLYLTVEGDLIRVSANAHTSGGLDTEVVASNLASCTDVFGGAGVIFAVGPTGELLRLDTTLINGNSPRSVSCRPESLGSAGWKEFRVLCNIGGSTVLALGVDSTLSRYELHDSSTGQGYGCAPTRTVVGVGLPSSSLEGYCWPQSVAQGASTQVYLSCPTGCSVEVVDLPDMNRPVRMRMRFGPTLQATAPTAARTGAGWKPTATVEVGADWPSGLYSIRLRDAEREHHIPFVVRPSSASSELLALASSNTWIAYNAWGGMSKYGPEYSTMLSAQRPNPAISPVWDGTPNHLLAADLWALDWLKREGYAFDVASDTDIHSGMTDLCGYGVIVLLTHPEYWTHDMRSRIDEFIDQGGSVVYLGGNGLFEVCEIIGDGSVVSFFHGCEAPDRVPALFRNAEPPRPERDLLGVGFRFDTDWKADPQTHVATPYLVRAGSHFAFQGTGLSTGDTFGSLGRNGGGACGWEMDTSIGGLVTTGLVNAKSADDRGTPPRELVLLARGLPPDETGYSADMTVYETTAGGMVYSAGSLCFTGSLAVDPLVQQVVRNVLRAVTGGGSCATPGGTPS